MNELINSKDNNELINANTSNSLILLTEQLLIDARNYINSNNVMCVPIAELSTLGAGVSSLVPALNTVTHTTTMATDNLYQLANAGVGDTLKVAKNGNFYGAYKTADGSSKFVQLKAAEPLTATTTSVAPLNPATMMMAVALFSIEQELGNIVEMEKQIISFLEIEKESEIETDVEMLMDIVKKYKNSWDKENVVSNYHNQVLNIQRTARKNMNSYQKMIKDTLKEKQFVVDQGKINSRLADFEKKFQYYRLSLYTYSLASLMEIMLSGNFREEYIAGIKADILTMSETYRKLFGECSLKLERMSNDGLDKNLVKGIGTAGQMVGKFIGTIPIVKDSSIDEFLQDKGANLQKNAVGMEKKAVRSFASVSNPETGVFVNKMDDMIKIYNHTSQIYLDNENIYLLLNQ